MSDRESDSEDKTRPVDELGRCNFQNPARRVLCNCEYDRNLRPDRPNQHSTDFRKQLSPILPRSPARSAIDLKRESTVLARLRRQPSSFRLSETAVHSLADQLQFARD